MYSLSNGLNVSLFINNIEYNLANSNVLNFIHMGSSVTQTVPTIHFSITDTNSDIIKDGIPDGILLRVVISTSANTSNTYNFRKYHSNKQLNGGVYTYDVDGYLVPSVNSVKYWLGTECTGLAGSSNEVLQQIANICGLKYQGTLTNDSQAWFQQNKTYGNFAKSIRKHGYIDNKSCMSLALDLNGTLIYSNLNGKPASTVVQIVAYQRSASAITAIDYSVTQSSGFNNQMTGYSMGLIVQSLVSNNNNSQSVTSESVESVVFVADVKAPLLNTKVKNLAKRGAYSYSGVDSGNTHLTYDQAEYQNTRYSNLFSLKLEVLLDTQSNIPLLSHVNFAVTDLNNNQSVAYSGLYQVISKAIYIQGVTYAEKLEIVRHGTNDTYTVG